ncbi:MAG: methyltransferase domain-containing protein [Acidobacteriota bacterium]|nr:methyltransferase domain-containing protein [Acidobacteriota bacterium]
MDCDRQVELLDQDLDPREAARALRDLERATRWLLGIGPVIRSLLPRLDRSSRGQRILDLGTGSGQIPDAVSAAGRRRGLCLEIVGVDRKLEHLLIGRDWRPGHRRLVAEAEMLPFRTGSFDWSFSTLLLHHFDGASNRRILAEMTRVSATGVVVVDLRRSRVARLLSRALFRLLRLGTVATHDGRVSLEQAWTISEVERLAADFEVLEIRRRFPFRLCLVLGGTVLGGTPSDYG